MDNKNRIFKEVKGLYKIIELIAFRRTPKVAFDIVPKGVIPHIDGIDRVIHECGAFSPGAVGDVKEPWYMHPHQEDNLIVLQGYRTTDLYTKEHGILSFEVSASSIKQDGKILFDGPAILAWPCRVFHRVKSCEKAGSASLNFAVRGEEFDIKTNFSIYDLNTQTGEFKVIREGHLDQKM